MADRKRPPIVILIIPLMVAFAGLNRVTQSPSSYGPKIQPSPLSLDFRSRTEAI
jgi:hypothetical protein